MIRTLTAALLFVAATISGAAAQGWPQGFPWYPLLDDPRLGALERTPPCTDQALADRIVGRFNAVEETYWGGRIAMRDVVALREVATRDRTEALVARRWCHGTAVFADGVRRRIVVELGANTGHLGVGYGLSYCIHGLDRHWTYAPACRVLRRREY